MSGQKQFVSLPLTKAVSVIQGSPKRAHYFSPFTFCVLEKTKEEGGGVWRQSKTPVNATFQAFFFSILFPLNYERYGVK